MLRRRLAAVSVLAAAVLVAGCGGGGQPAGTTAKPEAFREFVGRVQGSADFIAVAVRGGEVEAYVCDGHGHRRLFKGRLQGGRIELVSVDKQARLHGTLAQGGVSGRLVEGKRTLAYSTVAARDYGGLYTVHKQGANMVRGRSLGGNTLTLRFTGTRATGTVTRPDGRRLAYDRRFHPHRSRYLDFRTVMLNDGRLRGNRTVTSRRGSRDVIDPFCSP